MDKRHLSPVPERSKEAVARQSQALASMRERLTLYMEEKSMRKTPERYEILIHMDSATYEDWLGGIFTKTVCEAKNRNQLLKAVTMAEELGLTEGKDFFLINMIIII